MIRGQTKTYLGKTDLRNREKDEMTVQRGQTNVFPFFFLSILILSIELFSFFHFSFLTISLHDFIRTSLISLSLHHTFRSFSSSIYISFSSSYFFVHQSFSDFLAINNMLPVHQEPPRTETQHLYFISVLQEYFCLFASDHPSLRWHFKGRATCLENIIRPSAPRLQSTINRTSKGLPTPEEWPTR